MKPKPTGLMGFREFTFDKAIEHGIRSNVQHQINSVLTNQQRRRIQFIEAEREQDRKLNQKTEKLLKEGIKKDREKFLFKRTKAIETLN